MGREEKAGMEIAKPGTRGTMEGRGKAMEETLPTGRATIRNFTEAGIPVKAMRSILAERGISSKARLGMGRMREIPAKGSEEKPIRLFSKAAKHNVPDHLAANA